MSQVGASATSAHSYLFRPSPSYQSPILCIIFDPKYCMEVKSLLHCCMRGSSMLTEFLRGMGMVRWVYSACLSYCTANVGNVLH